MSDANTTFPTPPADGHPDRRADDRAAIRNGSDRAGPRSPDATASDRRAAPAPRAGPRGRRWLVLLAVAATLGAGVWYFLARDVEEQAQLVLQGNIDVRQVNLSFKVDGRIDRLLVDEGDAVKGGQVVASLDKSYFLDELRVARAARDNLAAALAKLKNGSRPEEIDQARALLALQQATLERTRRDYGRAKRAVGMRALSTEDFDQAQAALGVAEANVKYAKETLRLAEIGPRQEDIAAATAQLAQQDAAIRQTERRLTDGDLIAPNDGFILTRAQERGAIVQAGTTVFTETLASPVWVRAYVNERDLGLIQPGMRASVTTDTAPRRPYAARIGFISPTAEFTPKAVETRELRTDLVYRLRVIADDPDGGLRQGMPVTVSLPLDRPRPKTFWERVRSLLHLD